MKPKELIEMTTRPKDSLHSEVRGKTLCRKMMYIVICVVIFTVVAGAVLLSVYLGIKMTQDNCNAAIQSTFEAKHMARRYFDVTDIWLNNEALGQRSSELCKGKYVYFLLEKSGQTTEKIKGDECTQRLYFEETRHSHKNASVKYANIRNYR